MDTKVFDYLVEKGCCKYCSLRYLCDRTIDFTDINKTLEKKNLLPGDSVLKRAKSNPCLVCLDLLSESVMDDLVDRVSISQVQKYDSPVFTCSISIPAATIIREHSLRLDLKTNFPDFYVNDIEELALNRAWKFMIKDKLAAKLGKTFENSDVCSFSINIVTDYANNTKELSVIKQLVLKRHKNADLTSRKFITSLLALCPRDLFESAVSIPPEVPNSPVSCKTIECKHNSVYLAGRYCKFSRELSQSPWIIDGVKTMETSVEEIIFEELEAVLGVPKCNLKFSASGREDCDVRCLGKGRPFYVEIVDPTKTHFDFKEFRLIESNISRASLISVRDLQMAERADLVKVKEGEQSKTKEYVALCVTEREITQMEIDRINGYGDVCLKQKTPIRVLHRRPIAVRNKKVHSMKAELIRSESNLFELRLVTEAGTYVKEFVHGDFGRTKPSIGDIINMGVDILALDVVAINLDWPNEIKQ